MQLLRCKKGYFLLTECIESEKNNSIQVWLTDFGDRIYIANNDFCSFDGMLFTSCDLLEIEDWVAKLFFTVKG